MRKKYFERKWNIHFVEWSVAARKIPTIIAFIRADCCKIQRNRFVPLLFETDFFPFCDCRKNDKAVISKNFALDLYAIVNHGRSPITKQLHLHVMDSLLAFGAIGSKHTQRNLINAICTNRKIQFTSCRFDVSQKKVKIYCATCELESKSELNERFGCFIFLLLFHSSSGLCIVWMPAFAVNIIGFFRLAGVFGRKPCGGDFIFILIWILYLSIGPNENPADDIKSNFLETIPNKNMNKVSSKYFRVIFNG